MRRTMLSLTSCPCPSSLGRRGYQMVNTRRGGRRLRLQRGFGRSALLSHASARTLRSGLKRWPQAPLSSSASSKRTRKGCSLMESLRRNTMKGEENITGGIYFWS